MKIVDIRLRQVTGTLEHPGEFWEERLIRPIDVYPEHKAEGPQWLPKVAEGRYRVESIFVEVLTDEGVTGLGGPLPLDQAFIIDRQFKSLVLGEDPRATERIWDKLYRAAVHGRKGPTMMALSALDCALWDLRGRWAGAPVYRLLGGPIRTEIPAYASALGYALAPDLVRQRAREIVAQGYRATKWFFRYGPTDGPEGMRRNLALVQTLRETVGPDVEIMLDCWMSWDVPYAIAMAERLAEYEPRWLEEPVMPDKIDSYVAIRQRSPIPIAGGEHEYTRWGIKTLLDAGACDVLQPDTYWAGGITEMLKIAALVTAADLVLIPHGHSVPANAHLTAALPTTTSPYLEYLIKWNEIHQFFFKEPLKPQNGLIRVPDRPGLGVDLDPEKIESERLLRWD